ncbi:MAG TPA: BolA family protein [Eoetvoesiella sp.]
MSTERKDLIQERLEVLEPTELEIIDESHLHAGHAGSQNGASHFRLIISSNKFSGLSPVARHRLVYDLVHDLIPYPIHALSISASATK